MRISILDFEVYSFHSFPQQLRYFVFDFTTLIFHSHFRIPAHKKSAYDSEW